MRLFNFATSRQENKNAWKHLSIICDSCDQHIHTWSLPKVMQVIFLRSPERPGKESGSRGRWRGNPRIQLDLPQLSQRLCSTQYGRKVRSSFCVLSRAKMQRSLEQRYAIKFCVKLGKSGSET